MNNESNFDLLDVDLDDLADSPTFEPFPEGAHQVIINWEVKPKLDGKGNPIKGNNFVIFKMTMVETLELSDPSKEPAKAGDIDTKFIYLVKNDGTRNEYAEGELKLLLSSLKESFGGQGSKEIMENSNNMECVVVTKHKHEKDKETKQLTGVVKTVIVKLAGI